MSWLARNCLFFLCFAVFTSLFAKFLLHIDINKRTYNHVPGECGIIPNLPGIIGLATTTGGRLYMTVNSREDISDSSTHLFTFYSDNRTAREIQIKGAAKKYKLVPGPLSVTEGLENPNAFVFNVKTSNVDVFETDEKTDLWKYLKTLKHEDYQGLTSLSASGPNSFYFIKTMVAGSVWWFHFLERMIPVPLGQVYFVSGKQTHHVMYVSSPTGIVYDSLKKSLFVTSFTRNSFFRIKTTQGHDLQTIKEYDLGCSPTSIWKDFDGTFLVTCQQVRFRYLLHLLRMVSSAPSMVLRVAIPVDESKPISITQLYSNDGATISHANSTVRAGRSLLISNGDKILNCNL